MLDIMSWQTNRDRAVPQRVERGRSWSIATVLQSCHFQISHHLDKK
jgi:hypothetical protein